VDEILHITTTKMLGLFGQTPPPGPIVSRLLGFYILYTPFVLILNTLLFSTYEIKLCLLPGVKLYKKISGQWSDSPWSRVVTGVGWQQVQGLYIG
jgi:hypothetical protein